MTELGNSMGYDELSPEPQLEWIAVSGRGDDSGRIAVRRRAGQGVPVVWLGGFRSDMDSIKATALDQWAARHNRPFVRFDYSGHGESGGQFADLTVSDWLADTLAVLDANLSEPPILVGSSMGGWIALLAAQKRQQDGATPFAGLVLIAPAVDFTETLMWNAFPEAFKRNIIEDGVHFLGSDYGDPYPVTKAFIEDGRHHLMLDTEIDPGAPVHIVQGMCDSAVPWLHTMRVVEHISQSRCVVTLVKDGDHRLSRQGDIDVILAAIESMTVMAGA